MSEMVDAGRLHRVAADVIASAERAFSAGQLDWFPEFMAWLDPLLGPRPREELGSRAHENWNMAAMGGLLAWGYFAEQLADEDGRSAADSSGSAPVVPEPGPAVGAEQTLPTVRPPTFAVLDAEGNPVIEGYRD